MSKLLCKLGIHRKTFLAFDIGKVTYQYLNWRIDAKICYECSMCHKVLASKNISIFDDVIDYYKLTTNRKNAHLTEEDIIQKSQEDYMFFKRCKSSEGARNYNNTHRPVEDK